MQNHSSKLQQLISKSDQEQIETLIGQIERRYPVEVVVALTDNPAVVPFAAARMVALLALLAELVAELLWLPVPAWILGLCVFLFLLAPIGRLQSLWLFRLLARREEKEDAVRVQSAQCFHDLGLARTKQRNALLLFFNVSEKFFCLYPDRSLEREWPELKIDDLVGKVKSNLQNTGAPHMAATDALKALLTVAHERWPDATDKANMDDQLPNALSWWTPH
jgi:uncharacterized membrane protein